MQFVILSEMKCNEESLTKKDSSLRYASLRMTIVLIFLFFSNILFSQKQFVLIDSQTKKEFIKKDSLSAVKFLDSLAENNFYFTQILNVEKSGEKAKIIFDKGKNFNEVQVKIASEIAENLKINPEFLTKNLDSLKKSINQKYIDQGFSFSRVKSKYLGMQNGIPKVEISVNANQQRKIDGFVVKGYEKVPKRFIKNLEKDFKGKIYDDKNLISVNQTLQNHAFVSLERPPQTLFTKDSTNVYLFLQKKKANTFDGIIGFGNDKSQKFTFNGSLNVNFRNIFNGFETINLFWQRNPNRGQTFDLQTDIPYLFKSNLGANFNVNIFRQDSAFANVKLMPAVFYHVNRNQRIGLKGIFETSSVADTLLTTARDFSKKGVGIWYDFTEPTEVELFLYKTKIRTEINLLATNYSGNKGNTSQTGYYIFGERNFHITGNNYFNLKAESAMLNSKNQFTTNELFRIGGWNSLRGFNENSLIADFYYYTNLEYRYLIGNQSFFDVFGQYGALNNKTSSAKPKFYSFGLGFNMRLPIGLMSFQISNGSEFGNTIKFGDTKIHWGILSRF